MTQVLSSAVPGSAAAAGPQALQVPHSLHGARHRAARRLGTVVRDPVGTYQQVPMDKSLPHQFHKLCNAPTNGLLRRPGTTAANVSVDNSGTLLRRGPLLPVRALDQHHRGDGRGVARVLRPAGPVGAGARLRPHDGRRDRLPGLRLGRDRVDGQPLRHGRGVGRGGHRGSATASACGWRCSS